MHLEGASADTCYENGHDNGNGQQGSHDCVQPMQSVLSLGFLKMGFVQAVQRVLVDLEIRPVVRRYREISDPHMMSDDRLAELYEVLRWSAGNIKEF